MDIINKLCATCLNNRCQNKKIEIENKKNCIVYKCSNYKMDKTKIEPYVKFPYCIKSNNDKVKKINLKENRLKF